MPFRSLSTYVLPLCCYPANPHIRVCYITYEFLYQNPKPDMHDSHTKDGKEKLPGSGVLILQIDPYKELFELTAYHLVLPPLFIRAIILARPGAVKRRRGGLLKIYTPLFVM